MIPPIYFLNLMKTFVRIFSFPHKEIEKNISLLQREIFMSALDLKTQIANLLERIRTKFPSLNYEAIRQAVESQNINRLDAEVSDLRLTASVLQQLAEKLRNLQFVEGRVDLSQLPPMQIPTFGQSPMEGGLPSRTEIADLLERIRTNFPNLNYEAVLRVVQSEDINRLAAQSRLLRLGARELEHLAYKVGKLQLVEGRVHRSQFPQMFSMQLPSIGHSSMQMPLIGHSSMQMPSMSSMQMPSMSSMQIPSMQMPPIGQSSTLPVFPSM